MGARRRSEKKGRERQRRKREGVRGERGERAAGAKGVKRVLRGACRLVMPQWSAYLHVSMHLAK